LFTDVEVVLLITGLVEEVSAGAFIEPAVEAISVGFKIVCEKSDETLDSITLPKVILLLAPERPVFPDVNPDPIWSRGP